MLNSKNVYILSSNEGRNFRVSFTEKNDRYQEDTDLLGEGYSAFECYDDTFVRHVFYTQSIETIFISINTNKNRRMVRNGLGYIETSQPNKEKKMQSIYSFALDSTN